MDKVVHFEIPADDMARAKEFYSSIFGWNMSDYPMPDGSKYTGAITAPLDPGKHVPTEAGAINGAIMERTQAVSTPVIAMNVNSVDAYVEKVIAGGGRVVKPKVEIGGMGYYGYVTDTEGNVIGLWEDIKKA